MSVSNLHILSQGPVIAGLLKVGVAALSQRPAPGGGPVVVRPGLLQEDAEARRAVRGTKSSPASSKSLPLLADGVGRGP